MGLDYFLCVRVCPRLHLSHGEAVLLHLREAWCSSLQNRSEHTSVPELKQGFHGLSPVGESSAQCPGHQGIFFLVPSATFWSTQQDNMENLRDGGAWWIAIYGVAQSQTLLKQLSNNLAY